MLGYPFAKNIDGKSFLEKYYFTVSKSGLTSDDGFTIIIQKACCRHRAGYLACPDFFFRVYAGIFKYTKLNTKK